MNGGVSYLMHGIREKVSRVLPCRLDFSSSLLRIATNFSLACTLPVPGDYSGDSSHTPDRWSAWAATCRRDLLGQRAARALS
ncbi:hypothetical protein CEXT_449981 [Caerostris extrusa]|uniref:Uncharacterized protein n=1 Tax=Caerostris extrusa TaxID=172846 RepID=A0AAV4NRP5_CAEEX|nr:hypothetical protein CEXT_449981 [Caerostris extrusa]